MSDAQIIEDWFALERYAKDNGFDSTKFTTIFPAGQKQCQFLDAYFGLIQIEGLNGFVTVRDMDAQFPGTVCIVHTESPAAVGGG